MSRSFLHIVPLSSGETTIIRWCHHSPEHCILSVPMYAPIHILQYSCAGPKTLSQWNHTGHSSVTSFHSTFCLCLSRVDPCGYSSLILSSIKVGHSFKNLFSGYFAFFLMLEMTLYSCTNEAPTLFWSRSRMPESWGRSIFKSSDSH